MTRRVDVRALALLVGAALALAVLGSVASSLATPRPLDLDGWAGWLSEREAPEVAMAIVRLTAVAAGWYVVGVSALAMATSVSGSRRAAHVLGRVTLPTLRRALGNVAGIGVTAGALTVGLTPNPGVPTGPTPTATLRVVDDVGDDAPTATLRELDAGATPTVAPVAEPTRSSAVTVVAGDHLWGLASDALEDHLGREPTDAEIVPYWRQIIEANRDRLVDPSNPDLILPGQELVVPVIR